MRTYSGRRFGIVGFVVCAVAAGAFACSSSDNSGGSPATGTKDAAGDVTTTPEASASTGTVVFTLTYNGTVVSGMDPLFATAWTMDMAGSAGGAPPSGTGGNLTANWPGMNSVTLAGVSPGTYYVFAYASVGAVHTMGPQPGDAVTLTGTMVTVTAGQTTMASATLVDFNPGGMMEGGAEEGGTTEGGASEGGTEEGGVSEGGVSEGGVDAGAG